MYYSDESISKLVDRIGWSPALEPSEIEVSEENQKHDSGRFFNDFHALATAEVVYACLHNRDIESDTLNAELTRLKKAAVLQVLSAVYDRNPRANYCTTGGERSLNFNSTYDYSDIILSRPGAFDEAIGHALVMKVLQLALTTNRSNIDERYISMSYSLLKGELEGFFSENQLIGDGAKQRYGSAIASLIDILFPVSKDQPIIRVIR